MASVGSPIVAYDGSSGLSGYINMAGRCAILTPEEEAELVSLWINERSKDAAQKLVVSHIRLVIKIAMRYKNYGLVMADMVSEGVLGLIKAVKKFDPSKGARFSTYAGWWVKAQIQSFIVNSWSLVKMGTTSAQRKLFLSLRNMKNKIMCFHGAESLSEENVRMIAESLDVSRREVRDMDVRMSCQDVSLNDMVGDDGGCEFQDLVPSVSTDNDEMLIAREANAYRVSLLYSALEALSERERDVIVSRKLTEPQSTLEVLGCKYGVSTERIRQIQEAAMKKIKNFVSSGSSARPVLGPVAYAE